MKPAREYGWGVDKNLDEFNRKFPHGVWKLFHPNLVKVHIDYRKYAFCELWQFIFCDGLLAMVTNSSSYHWKKYIGKIHILKIVECAKSCTDSWLRLNRAKMTKINWSLAQTIGVLDSWQNLCKTVNSLSPAPNTRKTCSTTPLPWQESRLSREPSVPSLSVAPAGSPAPLPSPCGSASQSGAASSAPLHTH